MFFLRISRKMYGKYALPKIGVIFEGNVGTRCFDTLGLHKFKLIRHHATFWRNIHLYYNFNCPAVAVSRRCDKLMMQKDSKYSTTGTEVVNNHRQQEKRVSQQQGEVGIFKRVLNKVGLTPNSKARLKVTSHMLYESVADRINYLEFFRAYNMPNTFNSWFLVTELHVWMLLVRSMAEGCESGEDGRILRNCIVEAMWGDVNTRAKKLGANNPSRTKQQIEILSEQFQAALIAYDEGVMSDDRILAAALWRRFFEMSCDDVGKIEALVRYVRQQISMLDHLPSGEFLNKPKIPWIDQKKETM